ncbi:MAG: VWA domain-containing protein, partial [Candidatus Acidiferrales bacterium]
MNVLHKRPRLVLMLAAVSLGCLTVALALAAQKLSPGEVRISSRAYQPGATIRAESPLVEVDVVVVEVVVRDVRGKPIAGLTKEDFQVFDRGKKRDLTAFSAEESKAPLASFRKPAKNTPAEPVPIVVSPPPSGGPAEIPAQSSGRWIGLFFDDINTLPGDLAHAKIASSRFIRETTASGDHIAVFTASGGPVLQFTSETTAVLAAVKGVEAHPRISPGGLAACPRITAYEAYQIVHDDPSAFAAKVDEACQCAGSATCGGISLSQASSAVAKENTSGGVEGGYSGPYGGSGALTTAIDTVKGQARQTWDQARLASQDTLDAIRASLGQIAEKPGKRMLLLASAGFLSGDLDTEQDAIVNDALRAGVVIDSVDAKGLYAEAPGGDLKDAVTVLRLPESAELFQVSSLADRLDSVDAAMAKFAESTGGLLFRNNNDLDLGFYELGVVPAYAYELGFPPEEDGKYHKLKVNVSGRSREFVEARPGYFAPGKTNSASAEEKVDAEMRGSDEKSEFPCSISEKQGVSKGNLRQVTIDAHVDIQKLPF